MFDLIKMHAKYRLSIKGVIHVGAHEGAENTVYQQMGFSKILFIEANPAVYKRLVENVQQFPNVILFQCVISDIVGTVPFHVTSMDQSSSILKLKHHSVVYPNIVEESCITINSTTLDELLKTLEENPSDFDFINIDIQGAELLAFSGAENLLRNHIRAINTEVNYEEMYEGCALKKDIDVFLARFGFVCKETTSPYHNSWGDAFYVKE